jgi:23S rRNA pseudouridine1911/1915/1917 synthase
MEQINIVRRTARSVTPTLHILYEDNHCLAIAKPAGTASAHADGREQTLDQQVKAYLKAKHAKPGNVFLGIVHRLDRPVSGVLLFARTSKAAARLAEQFREGTVEKVYWAVLEGELELASGTFTDWLWKDAQQGRVQVLPRAAPQARQAILQFEQKGRARGFTWLEVRPQTGRTHQIRVQFAHRGHPVVGDAKYGSKHTFEGGIALHARSLRFLHPTTREPITLVAELPETWGRFRDLGLS